MLLGRDRVDGIERETEQAVVVRVLGELRADRLGKFDGLAGDDGLADGDGVGVDVAAGAAAVAVLDVPGVAIEEFGGRGLAWVVNRVAPLVGGREFRGKDPAEG